MKKILALVLVAVMVMAVSSVALAAGSNTITINQPTPTDGTAGAETYNVYKIFNVTKTSGTTFTNTNIGTSNIGAGTATGFSYTIPADAALVADLWNTTTNTAQSGQTWVTLTLSADGSVYNVTWAGDNTEAAAKAFANWLLTKKDHALSSTTLTSDGSTATGSSFDDGYYLIASSLGTSLVLATTDVVINTKNSYITDEKSVAETTYNVGDKVKYTIVVNLPASIDYTKPVTVHDTMDDVLVVDAGSIHAKVTTDKDFDSHITYVTSDSFSASHDSSHSAATGKTLYDFVLDISSLAPATGEAATAKTITITYEAELTSAAAADTEYVNKEFTEYSKYKTAPNEVKVKTFDFDLKKTFQGTPAKELQATFKLYPQESGAKGSTAIQFIAGGTVTGKDITYVKADSDDTGSSDTIIAKTDNTGASLITNVRGLDAGTYYLTEQTTEDGYNLLTSDVVITISDTGEVSVSSNASASEGVITIVNNSGTVLPSTGGIGTTIFYIAGSLLVLGAGAILIARRKADSE